jgi:hypothetical protein
MNEIAPTKYQARVLAVPEAYNVFLGGGRGGGKSYCALLEVVRHVEQYRNKARPLVVRETYKAASELAETLHALLVTAYGQKAVRYNRAENTFRLGNGAVIEIGQLDGPSAYVKYQGRSFTLLVADELGTFRELRYMRLLRSNLRAPEGIPLRELRTANPGGIQHVALTREHRILQVPAWEPYDIDGETWVNAPSTFRDNPHLDGDAYERRLRAAVSGDEALLHAWIEGDWDIARGAFFGDVWAPSIHVLPIDFRPPWAIRGNKTALGFDYGLAAPSVALLGVRTPGGDGLFPAGSLLILDEVHSADPADPSMGLRWPPGKIAEAIRERCAHWNMRPYGVGDDAVGLDQSLLDVFRTEGVWMTKPRKGPGSRIAGWAKLRQRLANSVSRDGPGLYVTGRCGLFLETFPTLPRDELRPEDVDTRANDHAADAARYLDQAITQRTGGVGRHHGMTG